MPLDTEQAPRSDNSEHVSTRPINLPRTSTIRNVTSIIVAVAVALAPIAAALAGRRKKS